MLRKYMKITVCFLFVVMLFLAGCSNEYITKAEAMQDSLRKAGLKARAKVISFDKDTLVKIYIVTNEHLAQLKGVPFEALYLANGKVTDISALQETPLSFLIMTYTHVTDISPLKGKNLQVLDMRDAPVTDLTPLAGMSIKHLGFNLEAATNGLDVIRNMKSLQLINKKTPAQFWKDYDWANDPARENDPTNDIHTVDWNRLKGSAAISPVTETEKPKELPAEFLLDDKASDDLPLDIQGE